MAEDWRDAYMLKSAAELLLQLQSGKQRLENNQPGKRGELLVFEAQRGKLVGFTVNLGSATLHADGFLVIGWIVRRTYSTNSETVFLWLHVEFIAIFTILWNALSVNSRIRILNESKNL